MKKTTAKIASLVFSVAYFATPAYAYLDPGLTAMVTQIVTGIIISLGVVLGIYRRKILLFFENLRINNAQRKIEKQNIKNGSNKCK